MIDFLDRPVEPHLLFDTRLKSLDQSADGVGQRLWRDEFQIGGMEVAGSEYPLMAGGWYRRAAAVTVLSDGGEDISHACQLPSAAERVLDWFHIGMRFERLLTALQGLRGMDEDARDELVDGPKAPSGCSGTASTSVACSVLRRCDAIPAWSGRRIRSGA